MPKKKDRVITLRISENDFNIVEGFARAKGLSVSAYINSVIKSQTEYFIPPWLLPKGFNSEGSSEFIILIC